MASKKTSAAVLHRHRLRELQRRVGWWFDTATKHDLADEDCGREWTCACGPCKAARKALATENTCNPEEKTK